MWLMPDDSGVQHAANRLLSLLEMTREEYLRTFDRTNLLHKCQGRGRRGDLWDPIAARDAADTMIRTQDEPRRIILLGKRVGAAFVPNTMYFQWWKAGRHSVVVVPHPSGRNAWFNSPANRRTFRDWMRDTLS